MDLNRTHAKNCSCGMAVCRCPVDYVVYYAGNGAWIVERTSDKAEMARGSLTEMIGLIDGEEPKFPNGRRAHQAEDMLRNPPKIFSRNGSTEHGRDEGSLRELR